MNWLVVVKKVTFKIMYRALLHFILCVSTLFHNGMAGTVVGCRGQLKYGGTRAETRLRLLAKQTSPFGRARQFSQLLAAEVCTSAVVMPDTPCSEVE